MANWDAWRTTAVQRVHRSRPRIRCFAVLQGRVCPALPAEAVSGPVLVLAGLERSERFPFALLLQMLGISTEAVHDSHL